MHKPAELRRIHAGFVVVGAQIVEPHLPRIAEPANICRRGLRARDAVIIIGVDRGDRVHTIYSNVLPSMQNPNIPWVIAGSNINILVGEPSIASIAVEANESVENIGARRLHTVMEKLLEDISFNADERATTQDGPLVIDREFVKVNLDEIAEDEDLTRYIL